VRRRKLRHSLINMIQMRQISFLLAVAGFVVGCGHCDREEKVLATGATGRSVISEFEACTSFGTSLAETIELRSASGHSTTILKYVPNGGQVGCKSKMFPRAWEGDTVLVDWTNPAVIHISIGVVSSIEEKHDEVDGLHIAYDIGTLISEACKD
jgi:hypothetical protein